MNIRNTILGAGLWVVASGASALSLGGSRGAVVLGAPVDLTFEVQPDPGSDVASSCVAAALVAGDTPIGDARVRVTPLPEVRGRSPAVRVQAAVALDEPVLTVTLTAGCVGKTTRTYTFLSELPLAVARSASPVDVSRLSQASGAVASLSRIPQVAQSQQAPAAAALPAASSPVAPSAARAQVRPTARPPARPSAAPRAAAAAPQPAARSRLVVEPLDTWLDSPVVLRPSQELFASPSDEPSAQRAEAAALWRSLNAQPQDIQDSDRLKALEADAATLRAQAGRDRAAVAQLQQQLDAAEQERFPAMVVYVLGGLLLLALLLAAWIWARLRSASEKAVQAWRDSVAMGNRDAVAAHDAALGLTPHPGDTWTPSGALPTPSGMMPMSAPVPLQERFVSTSPAVSAPAALERDAVPVAPPRPTAAAPVGASVSATASAAALHIVNPEELFDVQQQAEFFVSVGEHQQAIEVLRKHIAQHRESSPLAYLELLRLYHTLSRVDEFTQLRKQFMESFNAQVPEFTTFHRTGRMLYHYTDALAEIEAEWTSPEVLLLLEKLLFRRTGAEAVEPFDLAAYDDLLLLLSIAQTTPASARGEPAPRKRTTPLAPPRTETLVAESAATPLVGRRKEDQPLDSIAAALEFDFDLVPAQVAESMKGTTAPAVLDPVTTRGMPLDLDLSEPPHLTLNDLPAVPVTAPPAAGQAVGFGMDNDLLELRLELEQRKSEPK
ncbi:MAG: FimV family protein [Acidovorax sp.]|uniref:type IV pilus assembly protein FimV n=1 Tax=Acidovorax sp. TaxID=1872122 RepID=UPI00391B2CB1